MDLIAPFTEAGFDLVHPFDAHTVARELDLPWLADSERPAGWLVGNTREFWPRFLAARRADAELSTCAHPIDRYLERTCTSLPGARCYFAHHRYDDGYVPIQRIAVAAGLGTLSRTNLVIHPTYGPWFALRAIVLTAGTPISRVLPPAPCDCAERCAAAFDRALEAQSSWRAWLAVRDACCVGRGYRYDDDQLEYHGTKSLDLLR
jgi:methylmalonic aciduria homocystinuria type C protein